MTQKHLSSQFDSDLNSISNHVLELGGLVESQMALAINALSHLDKECIDKAIALEEKVHQMELKIDKELITAIARRQPAARDLRLLIAFSKANTNLERAGAESSKIARMVKSIIATGYSKQVPITELRYMARLASDFLHKVLDGLARLDIDVALYIIRSDSEIDLEFDSFTRKLMTYMMEDPKLISACLNLLFIAKALERIGDHSKNIAEFVFYIVHGIDIRYKTIEEVESFVMHTHGN